MARGLIDSSALGHRGREELMRELPSGVNSWVKFAAPQIGALLAHAMDMVMMVIFLL